MKQSTLRLLKVLTTSFHVSKLINLTSSMITMMVLTNFNCYGTIVSVIYEFGKVKLLVDLNIWYEIWDYKNLTLHYILTAVASVFLIGVGNVFRKG
jgi:hypothetical protein